MQNTTFIPILIYFLLPLLALALYIRIIDKMKQEGINNLPVITLFVALFMYTMPALFILYGLIYNWSLSFFGMVLVIVTGPVIMLLNAVAVYNKRLETTYHWWIYTASAVYIIYLLSLAIVALVIADLSN